MEDNKQNFVTIPWTFVYSREWCSRNIRLYVSVPKLLLRSIVRSISTLIYNVRHRVYSPFYRVRVARAKSANPHGNTRCIYALSAYMYGPLCSRVDWFGRVKTNARRSTPPHSVELVAESYPEYSNNNFCPARSLVDIRTIMCTICGFRIYRPGTSNRTSNALSYPGGEEISI